MNRRSLFGWLLGVGTAIVSSKQTSGVSISSQYDKKPSLLEQFRQRDLDWHARKHAFELADRAANPPVLLRLYADGSQQIFPFDSRPGALNYVPGDVIYFTPQSERRVTVRVTPENLWEISDAVDT